MGPKPLAKDHAKNGVALNAKAIIERPVSKDALSKLGFSTHGTAVPERMRIYQIAGAGPSIEFWFAADNPQFGDIAGLKRHFPTVPGTAYRLTAELYDGYESDQYPNRIIQRVTVDGETLDMRDISAPAFSGWRGYQWRTSPLSGGQVILLYFSFPGIPSLRKASSSRRSFRWGRVILPSSHRP